MEHTNHQQGECHKNLGKFIMRMIFSERVHFKSLCTLLFHYNISKYEQEHIFGILDLEDIRQEKDAIRIKYQFKDSRPSVIEAFYNDKELE